MGYRGKVQAQTSARDLRLKGWTYDEIAGGVEVSKSSVSLWCEEGHTCIGRLSDRDFLVVGVALYAGEGRRRTDV